MASLKDGFDAIDRYKTEEARRKREKEKTEAYEKNKEKSPLRMKLRDSTTTQDSPLKIKTKRDKIGASNPADANRKWD